MDNKLDNFLKNKLSVDELDINVPELSLVNEARERIHERKRPDTVNEDFFDRILNYFNARLKPLQVGFAALLVIGSIFYFINNETSSKQGSFMSQSATSN